jgi:hypothetical protein
MMSVPRRIAAPLALAGLLAAVPRPAPAQQINRIPFQERPLAGTPSAVFSVGREEGQSWEMLNGAQQVLFDPQDNLYVLDRGNQRVLVFDRAGAFVRQIGKKGDGPGELQLPMGMALTAGGTLAVLDLGHRNLSLFGRDGRYLRSVPLGEGAGIAQGALAAHPSGAVAGIFRPLPMPGAGTRSGTFTVTPALTRIPLEEGGRPATLFEMPDGTTLQQNVGGTSSARQITMRVAAPPVFSPPRLWGILPDGSYVVAHTPGYTLKVLDANGRVVRAIQRAQRVRLATDADRERAREEQRERLRSGRGMIRFSTGGGGPAVSSLSSAEIEQRVREMRFADTIPALRGLTISPAGKLWIERVGAEWGKDGPIDLVTAQGGYAGTIRGQKRPDAISSSGRAAYLERDENDVERVVVKQLPAAWL